MRKFSKERNSKGKEKLSQAVVYVKLKEGVLDPQGLTIKKALEELGYENVKEVRSGKFFEIVFNSQSSTPKSLKFLNEISDKLLANPVIEKFEIEVLK